MNSTQLKPDAISGNSRNSRQAVAAGDFVVTFRGHAVWFFECGVGSAECGMDRVRVFSIVHLDEASRFGSQFEAARAARDFGLRPWSAVGIASVKDLTTDGRG